MSVIQHERSAIEALLSRFPTEEPEASDFELADGRIWFVGLSQPVIGANPKNTVAVFVPGREPADRAVFYRADLCRALTQDCERHVLVREPTAAERAACPFGTSVIRVAEAIEIRLGSDDEALSSQKFFYRPLGLKEFFVVC